MAILRLDIKKQLADFTLAAKFELPSGITALFGPSGSGKTQLARIISGLETADSGRLELNSRPLFEVGGICIPAHERRIGMVFQDHLLFPHKTVEENLLFGCPQHPSHNFEEIIEAIDIKHLLERYPKHLSGGERQRVAIGRALLAEPELLIMDEPLSSLDQDRKTHILSLIETLQDRFNLTILYITHALDEVLRLADHIVLLNAGKVRAAGAIGEVLSRHDLLLEQSGIGVGSVFEGVVSSHDDAHELVTLDTAAGQLLLPAQSPIRIGERVRIRIRAKDISLATSQIPNISTLNQLKCKIMAIHHTASSVLVELDAGIPLNAGITRKSLADLDLKVGSTVWALIKSVTVNSIEQ
ncbi:molybdenum ABC transporter ATP-binding protein [Sneathiella glossodoripedis]|uniref:molybdenum ABC transporter ATP-binding protein n=1 Tax=Sneathiella glossodoripedis TaxID=418853 RepID=UPI00046F90D1|nr:molybdenum ABC transporter ATP-binding protein [Sneathiella glossodoripedis]